jgi:hypothetical protein
LSTAIANFELRQWPRYLVKQSVFLQLQELPIKKALWYSLAAELLGYASFPLLLTHSSEAPHN